LKNIIAIIPARAGSKGVADKNIKPLGGFPLLQWSIEACRKSKMINKIMISTDSMEYKKLCEKIGIKVPFLRPSEISQDSSTDIEFILHALDWLSENDEEPDFLVHIRPTTPLRCPNLIDDAIKKFLNKPQYTSLRSVHEMSESAYKNFEIMSDGSLVSVFSHQKNLDTSNLARQSFPKTYVPNGYVDVLRTSYVKENNLLHGDNVMSYITNVVTEVDNEADFEFLEYQVSSDPSLQKKVFIRE